MDATQDPGGGTSGSPRDAAAIDDPRSEPLPKAPPSWLFRLVVPVTFIFVFSCFVILTHDLLGDQDGKFGAFLRKHGTKILAIEAAAAIVIAIFAMGVDRVLTLRSQKAEQDIAKSESGEGTVDE